MKNSAIVLQRNTGSPSQLITQHSIPYNAEPSTQLEAQFSTCNNINWFRCHRGLEKDHRDLNTYGCLDIKILASFLQATFTFLD